MTSARDAVAPTNPATSTYDSGGGQDYSDLVTWESSEQRDLVAGGDSEILDCHGGPHDDDVTIAGWTTDADNFVLVRSASGEGHDGTSNNGVTFSTTRDVDILRSEQANTQFQDLICTLNPSSTAHRVCVYFVSGNDQHAIGMINFNSTNSGTGTSLGLRTDSGATHVLCLNDNCDQAFHCDSGAGNTSRWYNCVAVDNGNRGFNHKSGTNILNNCLSRNSAADDFDTGFATGTSHNASGDATADDDGYPNTRINQTFTFVNEAGDDWHLADGDLGAKDFGTDLSADANFAFDDDINDGTMGGSKSGELFDTWDIGFDEPNPAAVGGLVAKHPALRQPLIRH